MARETLPGGSGIRFRGGVPSAVSAGVESFAGRQVVIVRSKSDRRMGALGRSAGEGIAAAARQAVRFRIPLVLKLESSGADVAEGVDALHGWGGAAASIAACSGIVPVICFVTGPVISGPALMMGLADVVVMTSAGVAFVSGPQMVAEFTGVRIGMDDLGGVGMHSRSSGLCALESETLEDAVGEILGFLPNHSDEDPPKMETDDPWDRPVTELLEVVPSRGSASYDVREVIGPVVDDMTMLELWGRWAPQVVTMLGRLAGRPIGVVANQPRSLAGTLDIAASQKAGRFVRFCDAFNLPIITFVDTPGFLPGKDLEFRGMIRHGAELAFAYAEATVPRISVILRKAFGGAYIVMDSKGLGNDICLAWPNAEIAVMGAAGATQILHHRLPDHERLHQETEYAATFLKPWPAAERGFVDGVIDPAETRSALNSALSMLETKRESLPGRKHDAGPM